MTQQTNKNNQRAEASELVRKLQGKQASPWLCRDCGSILGVFSEDRETVRIKYKDLFVYVTRGVVTVFCRTCGCQNTVKDREEVK